MYPSSWENIRIRHLPIIDDENKKQGEICVSNVMLVELFL